MKLAERLFRLQADGRWDTFYDVLPNYEEPLGSDGIDRYRALVEQSWAALPTLAAGRDDPYESARLNLEHAMESLAKRDGDVDALIRIWSKDLSASHRFAQIAELCAEHGRFDEGLAWAERGLGVAGDRRDSRLLGFCIAEYLRRRDFDRADALAWQRFESHPTADEFAALMKVAAKTARRDAVRERAIAHLRTLARQRETSKESAKAKWGWQPSPRTELVKLLLAEKDVEAAWDAFGGGPVATDVWPAMAAARAKTHPDEAIALYHRLLPVALERGAGSARYDDAFDVVRKIGALRAAHRQQAEFDAELDAIRRTYRAKRNFIKLLATLGASAG
nr:hypothetical protein [Burkholderia ubonensis]